MKYCYLPLFGFLLILAACKKEISDATPPPGGKETLADEPVTPIGKPIPLPPGGKHQNARAGNIPIIMVHGFGGIGPGDMLDKYRYWGGFDDIPKFLTESGYPAFAAKVGPFSSNWDRAVELYYYIKGGHVDYGRFHSGQYGHSRMKGRYYPGIYPEWDADHPVHLLGHSMGGLTVRKLVTLLERGDAAERQQPDHSPVFNGDKTGWVKSVTTISTPHNGATLTYILEDGYIPFVRQLITSVAALAGLFPGVDKIYDFSLEQWGLEQKPGENWLAYAKRVEESAIWQTADYSGHDVTPEAALERKVAEPDSRNVYYFSISTKASLRGILTGWEYPRPDMFPALMAVSFPVPLLKGIGNYTRSGKVTIDSKWWPNDGAANVYGMSGPEGSALVEYNPAMPLQKGVWNHIGLYNGYDHFDVIGIGYPQSVRPFYTNIAKLLSQME
ncbi:esterase/lipase family protein [Chitinophaga sp. GCM10012297]|uniref:triacylglycerol lipase n=1 Tax=Chitinophaga chungangae TaxID=2821488 RepID=A0ABS3Y9C5_9BACT|nr:lipase [Chitinophaga chungangae]MBO9151281.1 lipase [Chitinophaga chungangae]